MGSWIKDWSLKLNINKCRAVSYGRKSNIVHHSYVIEGKQIERVECINDLGVLFDSQLKFNLHITEIVNKAYSRLGLIKRNFKHLSMEAFCLLYKTIV